MSRTFRPAKAVFSGLAVMVAAWWCLEIQISHALNWDEIEFFRATRWIAEGRIPYRDFWEHHSPLQWFIFAPAAARLGDLAGVAAVTRMRWAQLPLILLTFTLLRRLSGQVLRSESDTPDPPAGEAPERATGSGTPVSLLLLAMTPAYALSALEYRVDNVGNLLFVGALSLLTQSLSRSRWIAFGILMSSAVLANMRLAPLVIATAALASVMDASARRWKVRLDSLWMAVGVGVLALMFYAFLAMTSSLAPAIEGLVQYNLASDAMVRGVVAGGLRAVLLQAIGNFDLGAVLLIVSAAAGGVRPVREWRRPSPALLILAVLMLSVLFVQRMAVQYAYHLELTWLLTAPLAALGLSGLFRNESSQSQNSVRPLIGAGLASVVLLLASRSPLAHEEGKLAYQDVIMKTVDARTHPGDRVLDGVGYALRRKPQSKWWFLPLGVRLMSAKAIISILPIDKNPPAAIVHGPRLAEWLGQRPRDLDFAAHEYLPLFRDLWIPGMSATLSSGATAEWRVVAGGDYRAYASRTLAQHPWFRNPLAYAAATGPGAARLSSSLAELPDNVAARLRWTVNGAVVDGARLRLRTGDRLHVEGFIGPEAAVVVVPSDVTTLFAAPPDLLAF